MLLETSQIFSNAWQSSLSFEILPFSFVSHIFVPLSALSPPPPYPRNYARFKIAFLILMPVMFATALVPAWIWLRGASLAFGFGFFGQPVIDRGLQLFVEKVPDWQVKLDIRKWVCFALVDRYLVGRY